MTGISGSSAPPWLGAPGPPLSRAPSRSRDPLPLPEVPGRCSEGADRGARTALADLLARAASGEARAPHPLIDPAADACAVVVEEIAQLAW